MKAFEQIGRADQRHVSPGKVDRQITQGLLQNRCRKRCNRLGLSLLPICLEKLWARARISASTSVA